MMTNMTNPNDYRNRLLATARAIVKELEREDWEGSTVRELSIEFDNILREDEDEVL